MASFIDKIPQFNPYVQQLPVEAMVQVGMEKQKRYDEGIQRIQTQIDNIAGLPVIRDAGKKYLQSKLNELGSNLKAVASADFSNYQLVNSVGGMVNQITKDNIIQNEVSSTARYRKEMERMEEERGKGTLSPANEYVFNKSVNEWFNDETPGRQFKGKYETAFDIDKYVRETFNAIKPDEYTIDQIYQLDEKGNPIKQKSVDKRTGEVKEQYVLSTTMLRMKQEGIFPKRVQETLDQIFSNPQVNRQLEIDGEYNYRGYSPQVLSSKINITKQDQLNSIENVIRELNLKKNSATSDTEKETIQKDIDKYSQAKVKTSSEYDDLMRLAIDNPDAVRRMLYRNETRNNLSGMYTNIKESRQVVENPGWRAAFDIQKEANDQAWKADELRYKYKALQQQKDLHGEDIRIKIAELEQEQKGKAIIPDLGPIKSDFDVVQIFDQNYAKAGEKYVSAVDDLLFLSGIMNSSETDPSARRKIIDEAARKEGVTSEEFRNNWYQKALLYLNGNPRSNDPIVNQAKISAENAQKLFTDMSTQKRQIDRTAPDPDLTKGLGVIYATTVLAPSFSNQPNPKLSGMEVELTPDVQYDIALAYEGDGWFTDSELKNKAKAAQKRLEQKGITKQNVNFIVKGLKDVDMIGGLAPDQKRFLNLVKNIDKTENVSAWKDRAEAIREIYSINPTLTADFITGKEEVDKKNRERLKGLISTYASSEQNESPGFVSNATKMMTVAQDPKEGTVKLETTKNEVTNDIVPVFKFYNAKGESVGEMTVTPAEASNFGYNLDEWYSSPEVKIATTRMKVTGNNSTAFGDVTEKSTYRSNDVLFTNSDFPNLGNANQEVKANIRSITSIQRDGSQQELYYGYLYVNDGGNEYLKVISTPKSNMDEVIQQLKGITQQHIQKLISEQKQ